MVKRLCLCTNKQARADQLWSDHQCSNLSNKQDYECPNISSEDLLVEILKRMPVKSVCRMQCVCKLWNDLISSSFFVKHYHQNSSSIPITHKSYILFRMGMMYAFYHPTQGAPFDRHFAFESLPFVPLPFRTCQRHKRLTFLNAIHGVVCLTPPSKNPTSSRTILWNPIIRKYVVIPNSCFKFKRTNCYAPSLGFGFNSLRDDFNLIRLWMPFHPEPGDQCQASLVYEIFSTQEGIWSKAVGSKIQPGKVVSETSFFMNKRIHWIVSSYKGRNLYRSQYRVLTFDCERNGFTTMKLPRKFDRMEEVCNKQPVVFKCRGMLSVLALISGAISIWVMEEYGNVRTWKSLPYSECRDELLNVVTEETMLLMDAKRQAVSYAEKRERKRKVYYEIDGKTSKHILI